MCRLWLPRFVTKLGEIFYLPGLALAPCPSGPASPWSLHDRPVSPLLLPPSPAHLECNRRVTVLLGCEGGWVQPGRTEAWLPVINQAMLQLCSQEILVKCRLLGSPSTSLCLPPSILRKLGTGF